MKEDTRSAEVNGTKARRGLWFAALYFGGVLVVATLSYALRALVVF